MESFPPPLEAPAPAHPAPFVYPPAAVPHSAAPAAPKQTVWDRFRRRLGAAGAGLIALLAKLKAVLLLLGNFKLFVTFGTMAVSIAAYTSLWGFPFAVGIVVLLFVHEMGHVIQLRREGIRASAPIFIPFLGAMIGARSLGDNALAEAKVGLAGPVLGSIGAAVCVVIWKETGNDIWRALAYIGFLLNLFNLIPVVPLDGGRAMAAMTPWMWIVGFGGLVVLAFVDPNPVVVIVLVLGAFEIYRRLSRYHHSTPEQRDYYRVPPVDRLLIGAVYIALIALLVVGMHTTYVQQTLS
jgi:Zn-dependent protease